MFVEKKEGCDAGEASGERGEIDIVVKSYGLLA
jgi:hypothetical protein